jgi:hypothetical protein
VVFAISERFGCSDCYTFPMDAQIESGGTPAWAIQLVNELDAEDQKAKELVAGLTLEQLNSSARPGAWSVGQCLEHVAITNELYVAPVSESLAGQPVRVVPEITLGWFARWFIRSYVEPSPESKQARAPKKIVPGTQVDFSILDRFARSNQAVREVVRCAGAHDVNRVRFKNPFLPLLRFTVGAGLQIIVKHERRHLLQAERAKQSLALRN